MPTSDVVMEEKLSKGKTQGRIPETTLECIQHLRAHHPRAGISVEVEKPGRKGLRDLAREADVVFYSRSWAEVRAATTGGPKCKLRDEMHADEDMPY